MGRQIERIERKMQKQTHKYMLSMLIATMLLLSMLPIVPVSAQTVVLRNEDDSATISGGSPGTKVLVRGTGGFSPAVDVPVYWDAPIAANVLNTTDISGGGTFNVFITIPDDVYGPDHWLIIQDHSGPDTRWNMVPAVKLTPSTGLPGDEVTVKGSGFEGEKEVYVAFHNTTAPIFYKDLTPSPKPETDVNGTFTCTVTVPTVVYTDVGGPYYIFVNETTAPSIRAEKEFVIGATITLDVEEGPTGTLVAVDGRGFPKNGGDPVTITVGGELAPQVSDIDSSSDGTFSGQFVVPTVSVNTHPVQATAGAISSGEVDFDVTGTTGIILNPISGVPGDTIEIEGINFTATSGEEVTITYVNKGDPEDPDPTTWKKVTLTKTFTTNSTGGFKGTYAVPDHPNLPTRSTPAYYVNATDENDLYAEDEFRIVRTRAFVDPEEGPTGGKVDVWVEGLTGDADYNITIDGDLLLGPYAEGTLDASGQFMGAWVSTWVPTVPVGTYTVTVMDDVGVTAWASFEVTETTEFVLDPPNGPATYNITINAHYFSQRAPPNDVTVTIYNETDDWNLIAEAAKLTDGRGPLSADPDYQYFITSGNLLRVNDTGSFIGWFKIPELDLGDYWINATDEDDLGIFEMPFSIVSVTVEVTTVRTTYAQGEDITFRVKSTFPSSGEIQLMDAAGFNTTITIKEGTDPVTGSYQKIGDDYFAYPKTTPSTDAPLGTWRWTADVGGTVRKGSLSVVESTTGVVLIQRINELEADLAQLSDAVSALGSSIGGVSTDLGTVEGYVDELESDLAAVSAAVSGISASATAAETAATGAKAAADAANTTAQGISMAVYGAMALSLIAALAAIAAVLTLQRKVAG